MQLNTIEDQYYANIIIEHIKKSSQNNPIVVYIIEESSLEWEDDYSMQLDEIIEKLHSKKELQQYINYPIPNDILNKIVNTAQKEWKNDTDMVNSIIKDEIMAYLKIIKYLGATCRLSKTPAI